MLRRSRGKEVRTTVGANSLHPLVHPPEERDDHHQKDHLRLTDLFISPSFVFFAFFHKHGIMGRILFSVSATPSCRSQPRGTIIAFVKIVAQCDYNCRGLSYSFLKHCTIPLQCLQVSSHKVRSIFESSKLIFSRDVFSAIFLSIITR